MKKQKKSFLLLNKTIVSNIRGGQDITDPELDSAIIMTLAVNLCFEETRVAECQQTNNAECEMTHDRDCTPR